MDMEEFMEHGLDSDDNEQKAEPKASKKKKKKQKKDVDSTVSETEDTTVVNAKKNTKKAKKNKKAKLSEPAETSAPETSPRIAKKKNKKSKSDAASSDEKTAETEEKSPKPDAKSKKVEEKSHKKSLDKLAETDPEFYNFLKNEDKDLLNFEESDSDQEDISDEEEDEEGSEDGEEGPRVHKPPQKLEVASDASESDSSDEEEEEKAKKDTQPKKKAKKSRQLTLKMISHWSQQLQTTSSLGILHEAITAFKSAVQQAGAQSDDSEVSSKYIVEGSAVFNAIISLCIKEILPTLQANLKVPKSKDPKNPTLPSSCKKWKAVKNDVKSYLGDLIQLTGEMSEPAIVTVLLKHMNQMVPYYACYPKLIKTLLKKLIGIWSSGEETARVLAFLTINKLTVMKQDSLLEFVLKQMYMAYVKNCKFTSPVTLPLINFMQRSLVELFALDVALTYQYAFMYIRQLAIHLRNAITVKKTETVQAVYNWQYIHSLELWARLLSTLHPNPALQPLVYPLTQTIIGTIKLVPTARYYPLRFHCVRALNMLALPTGTFIPTLPFILEIFQMTDFNKKHKSLGHKPFNFACILKFSKVQLTEKNFRDGLIDQIYEHLLESMHVYSYSIAFPELALPAALQMKQFLKKCKVANYTKQVKQILDKVQETSNIVKQRRRTATINLADAKTVQAWEARSKQEGTPISKYYATWRKLRDREITNEIAGKDRAVTELPEITRPRGPRVATEEDRKEFSELFESDSEDDDDETRFLPKDERPKKKKQKTSHDEEEEDSDDSADYDSFDDEELEQLAQSASEGEDSEDEDDDEEDDDGEDDDEDDEEEMEAEDESDDEEEDGEEKEDIVEDFKLSDLDSD